MPRWVLALVALTCVGLQIPGSLPLAGLALGVWLAVLALWDRPGLARMWMPRFWLITILLGLGSGMLLGRRDMLVLGLSVSRAGFEAGALMVVRGAFIFGLAIWASRAVSERDIRRMFGGVGLGALGSAIATALGLLPELERQFHRAWSRLPRRGRWSQIRPMAVELFCETALLAQRMAGPVAAVVVGPPGAGKTTTLLHLVQLLRQRSLVVGGVVQPGVHDADGARVGYTLRDLGTGEERELAHRRETRPARGVGELRSCAERSAQDAPARGMGYEFDPRGWGWARDVVAHARGHADVVVVDELGRLESEGQGHMPALLEPVERGDIPGPVLLLGVRQDRCDAILRRLGVGPLTPRFQLPASEATLDRFVASLARRVENSSLKPDKEATT